MRYAVADLPRFLRGWCAIILASSPERALHSALAELPLIRRSLIEHEALIEEAGVPQLLRRIGWIKLFRSEATLANALHDLDRARQYGVDGEVLDAGGIAEREPGLTGDFAGAIRFPAPGSFPIPADWQKPMPRCSRARADALWPATPERSNSAAADGASPAPNGAIVAREIVVALGPWSDLVFGPLGYSIPLAVKRGYHLHLKPHGNAVLNHPVLDFDPAFCWRR